MKKRWIIILLTILFLWFVASRFAELEQLKTTLATGQWEFVLAAVLAQGFYYTIFASSYHFAFKTVDIPTRTRDLIPITLGSLFVNVVVPAGGAGGVALFAETLTRQGKSAARVATGMLLQLITDLTAFTLLLIPGMVYLFMEHDLKFYEIGAAIILFLITTSLSSILLIGIWRPGWLHRLFAWFQRTAKWVSCRLHRSPALAEDWSQKNADEINLASAAVAGHPARLLRTVGIVVLAHLVDLASLYLLFLAFNQPISPGALVSGYAICILFRVVSITPQGIGIVEAMMTLVFTSLGIPGSVATTVTLAYRGLTFWFPMLLGFLAVHRMHSIDQKQRTLPEI